MPRFPSELEYSDKYYDDLYEYRHVQLTENLYNRVKDKIRGNNLLTEDEWRALGIVQSRGWVHYATFYPDAFVLHFRRPKGTDPITGTVPANFQEVKRIYESEQARNLEYEAEL